MPGIGIGIGLNRLRLVGGNISPTNLTASFDIPSISGQVSWVDNSGGTAQYEVYSSYNGNPYVFLGTTLAGATSYIDTTCKQNASVVYRIRAKKGSVYSEYATTSAINTPLCLKTNQSVLNIVNIGTLNLSSGVVNVNWGDGTNTLLSGNNSDITKKYSTTGQYDISFNGDTGNIVSFIILNQSWIYGDISNYVLGNSFQSLRIPRARLTGDLTNFHFSNNLQSVHLYGNLLTGDLENIEFSGLVAQLYENSFTGAIKIATNDLSMYYDMSNCNISRFNDTSFRKGMTLFSLRNQKVLFPTSEVDIFFKNAADWYQLNTPTANCTYNLSGANMGIPTDGVSNVDIVRLIGYYSAAGFAATVLVRTN